MPKKGCIRNHLKRPQTETVAPDTVTDCTWPEVKPSCSPYFLSGLSEVLRNRVWERITGCPQGMRVFGAQDLKHCNSSYQKLWIGTSPYFFFFTQDINTEAATQTPKHYWEGHRTHSGSPSFQDPFYSQTRTAVSPNLRTFVYFALNVLV